MKLTGDDEVKLEKFLELAGGKRQLAGGKRQAVRLETLINLAVNKDADRVADLLNLPECRAVAEFKRLANAVPLFKQTPVGTPLIPRNLTPPPSTTEAQAFSGADMVHLLIRHTYEYYNFTGAKAAQSFWPVGTTAWPVGTTAQDVVHILEETIDELRRTGTIVHPITVPGGGPISVPLISRGITVQFGVRGSVPYTIGQFFPASGPDVEIFTKAQSDAIKSILVL